MHRQNIDSLMPFLSILPQPAFCIRSNGTVTFNNAAKHLIPSCAADLTRWLGDAKLHYDLWDRSSSLQLCVCLNDTPYSAAIHALQDGTLFLLSSNATTDSAKDAMGVTSQVLRQPLADLSSTLYTADSPPSGSVNRHMHRLTRIVANLTDLSTINEKTVKLSICPIDLRPLLLELSDQVCVLCQKLGHEFRAALPCTDISFIADPTLLKRAILNMVSNALKFSPPGTPITLRTETIGNYLMLQVENQCTDDGQELLRAAFDRLSRRNMLPDPNWGIGLGLPLVNTIARLHGGMVAVETANATATVSLSVCMTKFGKKDVLELPFVLDYTGGMNQALLELSDVLPADVYEQ